MSRATRPKYDLKPVVRKLSADCTDLVLEFTTRDGDRVIGEYSLAVWGWPPEKIRRKVTAALSKPPTAVYSHRGRGRLQELPEQRS